MARPLLVATELRLCCHKSFSTASPRASVLFALSSLSNSRETQHLNKLSRLSRVEHSPSLKLIKMSEVDPVTSAKPKAPTPVDPALGSTAPDPILQAAVQQWDVEALNIGRAILAKHAEQVTTMTTTLQQLQEREAAQQKLVERERLAWRAETQRLRNEVRVAGTWIVLSIATATALASWRFWPRSSTAAVEAKFAELSGGGMATNEGVGGATAREVMSIPESVAITPLVPVEATIQVTNAAPMIETPRQASRWGSLFWKQN